jgi:hypothetical protein
MLSVVAIRFTAASLNAWVKLRRGFGRTVTFLDTLVLPNEQCALFLCLSLGGQSKGIGMGIKIGWELQWMRLSG